MEALPSFLSSYWLMRQSLVLQPISFPYKVGLCRLLPPLLNMRPSRDYLCNPCVVAWILTPQCLSAAFTHFFAKSVGFTFEGIRLAHQPFHAMQLQHGRIFRGCNHSIIFRLLHSLDLQVAPTAAFYSSWRPGRLHHAIPRWLPAPGCGIATCPHG